MGKDEIDFDEDGVINQEERSLYLSKRKVIRRIAIAAMIAMIFESMWIVIVMEPDKVEAIGSVLDLFWLSMSGIVATFIGGEAYVNSKR